LGIRGVGRRHHEGRFGSSSLATSFAPVQPVGQQVGAGESDVFFLSGATSWLRRFFFNSIEAPMTQLELKGLLCRLDAPSVVDPKLVAECKTYRDAVRLCWRLRRVHYMTHVHLAAEAGLYAPHVSCYLSEDERKRDLPGRCVRAFEWVCGNTAVSQFHAMQAKLTCLEEIQATRALA
jgi:hypothetical protein